MSQIKAAGTWLGAVPSEGEVRRRNTGACEVVTGQLPQTGTASAVAGDELVTRWGR